MIHHSNINKEKRNEKVNRIQISVLGAVRYHGPFSVIFGSTIRYILSNAELLYDAELKDINFDKRIFKSQTLSIPFKEGVIHKFKLKDLTQGDLLRAGIRNKTSIEIIDFIRKKNWKNISWRELDSLRGVGIATLNLLKKILELN